MDDSTIEQFSLTLQYVDENMEIYSDFLGFYDAPGSSGGTLFSSIRYISLAQHPN